MSSSFCRSRPSSKIATFWSHSWHGSVLKKILTLVVSYNSRPACLLGLLSALLMAGLFVAELLPGTSRVGDVAFSNWAVLGGTCGTALGLLLWRPGHEVFLDRICISQEPQAKTEAIFSLAGFMKLSDQMPGRLGGHLDPFRLPRPSLGVL